MFIPFSPFSTFKNYSKQLTRNTHKDLRHKDVRGSLVFPAETWRLRPGLGCSSEIKYLPSIHEALGLIPSSTKTKTTLEAGQGPPEAG
jgi:hypothetical protein